MKQLLFYLALLITTSSYAQQNTVTLESGTAPVNPTFRYKAVSPDSLNHLWINWNGKYNRLFTATEIQQQIAAANPTITGFTVTSLPTIGQTITTGTVQQAFAQLYQQSQPPTASLTGGTQRELTSATTENSSINYSYGKQTGTQNISSATIAGSTAGVTQNANGASGSYAVTLTANTTNTYTLLVTTVDSKTATSSTSFTYLPRRYFGRASGSTPSQSEILAAAGGGSALSNSKAGTFVITASGTNYPFFAYPSSLGTLTSIKDANGLEAITSYNTGTLSFTNGQGYSQTYRYYIAQNATAGNTTMVTQ